MILLVLLVFAFHSSLYAEIVEVRTVGPDVIYYHDVRPEGPWQIHILEIDLSNQWNRLETVKADNSLHGLEKTSSMALRNDYEAHRVLGAINGDFYEAGGIPVGAQVAKGILLKRPDPRRSVFAVTNEKSPRMDVVTFDGDLFSARDTSISISGINRKRETDELILFNPFFGGRTETNYWGTEITARYVTEQPTVNDSVFLVVETKDSIHAEGHGNNTIPSSGVVFSGHGKARDFLNHYVFVGDTVSLVLRLLPMTDPVLELIGGTPRLIRDGLQSVEWQKEQVSQGFTYDRHPRTAVGISPDSTKVYFFTVDGRQPEYSVGMSLFELSDYMLEWNVCQGVNLDGGGSTTMIVRGKAVNSPSDASGERAVANALMVISTAPTGPLTTLEIQPDNAYVVVDCEHHFSAEGFDEYFNPVAVDPDSLEWSCHSAIGTIDSNGLFTAGSTLDSGYVYVQLGSILDSAKVHLTDIASIKLKPNPVILRVGEKQTIVPEAGDTYGNVLGLSVSDYQWSMTEPIGEFSAPGLFVATRRGHGYLVATYHAVSGSTAVTVGASAEVILDDFSSVSIWSLSGVRVDLSASGLSVDTTTFVSAPSSARLDYRLTTGGTSALYLNGSIPISGTPRSVGLHVYGDGNSHWLRGEFQDADGERFLVSLTEASPGIDWNRSWRYLEVDFEDAIVHWANPNAVLTFPITWKRIYLAETNEGRKDSGTIFLDDFKVTFVKLGLDDSGRKPLGGGVRLVQNYPNPFNPKTTMIYHLSSEDHVTLAVYNLTGQLVSVLVNGRLEAGTHTVEWDATNAAGQQVSAGIYLCRIKTSDYSETRKMILLQ